MALVAYRMFCRVTQSDPCMCVCPGLVPEPSFQREAHEAAERAGRPEARVFPEPEADEDAGGPTGARGAHPQRALLLLWRYAYHSAHFVRQMCGFFHVHNSFLFFFPHCEISNFMF